MTAFLSFKLPEYKVFTFYLLVYYYYSFTTFTQDIYYYRSETNHFFRVYSFSAIP